MELLTENLRLALQTSAQVLAMIDALTAEDRAQVSPVWLKRVRASTKASPWTHGFTVANQTTGAVVGHCAYKGPPDANGTVEIAYGVHPECQGRGYATEMAKALVEYAFGSGAVRVVCAHTKSENIASARVLIKCGFTRIGEVIDPEDGLVDRWERMRSKS